MKTSIKDLQTRVNQIAAQMDGIETPVKLREAQRIAREDSKIQGLLLDILDEALRLRHNKDTGNDIDNFIVSARERQQMNEANAEVENIRRIAADFFSA